jgi:hypothetical protein
MAPPLSVPVVQTRCGHAALDLFLGIASLARRDAIVEVNE